MHISAILLPGVLLFLTVTMYAQSNAYSPACDSVFKLVIKQNVSKAKKINSTYSLLYHENYDIVKCTGGEPIQIIFSPNYAADKQYWVISIYDSTDVKVMRAEPGYILFSVYGMAAGPTAFLVLDTKEKTMYKTDRFSEPVDPIVTVDLKAHTYKVVTSTIDKSGALVKMNTGFVDVFSK